MHRENRGNGPEKFPVRENRGKLGILPKQGILADNRENTSPQFQRI